MMSDPEHNQRIIVYAAIFTLFLWGHASAGEIRFAHRSAIPRQYDKEIRLQLRIAEAKKNRDSLRYYKSVSRQRKMSMFKRPAQACGVPEGSARLPSD